MNQLTQPTTPLAAFGATPEQQDELRAYSATPAGMTGKTLPKAFPLAPEPHVQTWERYVLTSQTTGIIATLQDRLVQLQFPIQQGISHTEAYRAATRRGEHPAPQSGIAPLRLHQPDSLELIVHPSLAGAIPVLIVGHRADFVALVQALAYRNEPRPIPDSMGACLISGLNNWDRIEYHRQLWQQEWEHTHGTPPPEHEWAKEFQRLLPQRDRYQDRFIILSRGAYSHVPASELGVSVADWERLSLTIRLAHECTHYFTRRVLGSMRNHALDELMADYCGIVAAIGHYRADWFRRFMGLDTTPNTAGRLANYRGDPPLSDGALSVLGQRLGAAAHTLERFDQAHRQSLIAPHQQASLIVAVMELGLDALAHPTGAILLQQTWQSRIDNFDNST